MKWRISGTQHDIGAIRKTRQFAYWPTEVEGYRVWLEEYWLVEKFNIHGWEEYTKWL